MRIFIITIFFLIANILSAQSDLIKIAHIQSVTGEAILFSDYLKRPLDAHAGARLFAGDTLTPQKGSVRITIDNDTTVNLFEGSSLTVNSRWNVVQKRGLAGYQSARRNEKSVFEVITDFATLFSTAARFSILDEKEKRITVQEGTVEVRNFEKPFQLVSSDLRCGPPFQEASVSFFLKPGERAEFVAGFVIKNCGEIPDKPVDDEESVILFYIPTEDGVLCNARYKDLDKKSDINRIFPKQNSCLMQLESDKKLCIILARDNALFSSYRKTGYGVELELIPIHQDGEAFAQFHCR